MGYKLSIEYCTSWGYLSEAVGLTKFILGTYKDDFEAVQLIPSAGGVFLVTLNDEKIYSKKEKGRFPRNEEIEEHLNVMKKL